MIKLSELETLKTAFSYLRELPRTNEVCEELKAIITKYELVNRKIRSKTKPFLEGELYELKVTKGLSVRQIIDTIYKRRGIKFSRSTIEKAFRVEKIVGKGKMAEKYFNLIEKKRNATTN